VRFRGFAGGGRVVVATLNQQRDALLCAPHCIDTAERRRVVGVHPNKAIASSSDTSEMPEIRIETGSALGSSSSCDDPIISNPWGATVVMSGNPICAALCRR